MGAPAQNILQHAETPAGQVRQLLSDIEDRAVSGDWSGVEELTASLRAALLAVPEHTRRPLVLEVQQATEKVTLIAMDARAEVGERIATVRRGQAASKAYGGG